MCNKKKIDWTISYEQITGRTSDKKTRVIVQAQDVTKSVQMTKTVGVSCMSTEICDIVRSVRKNRSAVKSGYIAQTKLNQHASYDNLFFCALSLIHISF